MDFEDDLGDLGDFDFAEVDRLVEQHQATRVPVDGGQGAPVGAATDVKSAGTGVGESVRLQESKWHCASTSPSHSDGNTCRFPQSLRLNVQRYRHVSFARACPADCLLVPDMYASNAHGFDGVCVVLHLRVYPHK